MTSNQVIKTSLISKREKAVYSVLVFLALAFAVRYVLWWFQPEHIPHNWPFFPFHFTDIVLFIILSFVVFIGLTQRLANWFSLWFMARPKHLLAPIGLHVAFITCFVPGKEPLDLLEKTLEAMVTVRYPHDSWVLDEGNDEVVKAVCKRLGVKHFSRAGIEKYNQETGPFRAKTKAGNHNAWRDLYEVNYDIVAQIDMDHVPKPEYLERTLGYFADCDVAFVGMPQIYKNIDNWIARGAAEQAYFFHGPVQQGFFGCNMPFLIGTSHLYRTSAMKKIGGYAPTIVEDHLTGMRFYAAGYKGVFVSEILAEGEGPVNWVDYFNQQMRWSYGLFEILFKHTPRLFFKFSLKQKINYGLAQLYYFTGVGVFFGIILTALYLIFGIHSASMDLFEWATYSFPPFLAANFIHAYAHRFNINPKIEPRFGLLGMFLGLGANLIYALAFFRFITGRKLRYMVTQKGTAAIAQTVSLKTFTLHLAAALVMAYAFFVSFLNGNTAIQLRFWALFNAVTLFAVVTSTYWDTIFAFLTSTAPTFRIIRQGARFATIAVTVILIFITLPNLNLISEAFFQKVPRVLVSEMNLEPIAGKISAPQDGAMLGVSLYNHNDQNALLALEKQIGKQFALVSYYQSWQVPEKSFNKVWATFIAKNGAIPFITWEPWIPVNGFERLLSSVSWQSHILESINRGDYDEYVTEYAREVRGFKKPVMIRFAHEMNGDWYPWGSTFNSPNDYIAAWRRIHEIFAKEGAVNVTWVWSPNELFQDTKVPYSDKIDIFYPGDGYVDWVGFSAFNWAGLYRQNRWRDPSQLFTPTITVLKKYQKPILITETASAEIPGKPEAKAEWVAKFTQFLQEHEEVKGFIWFNTFDFGIDWSIGTSAKSLSAFKEYFSTPYFK